MVYVYAIVRNPQNPKILTKIQSYVDPNQYATDAELCKFFQYAVSLSGSYCSFLPEIKLNELKSDANSRDIRNQAYNLQKKIYEIRVNNDVVAISHRFGGFRHFDCFFGENISFHIYTNFGFGCVSEFNSSFKYKDVILAPYSYYVKYKNSTYASVTKCTYSYKLVYEEWNHLMDDCLSFYYAILNQDEHYVFTWLNQQLGIMVTSLEQFVDGTSFLFYDEWENIPLNLVSSQANIVGDDFWIIKSKKIANSLEFVQNIKKLPVQINSDAFINRLFALCNRFLPKLEEKINSLQYLIESIQAEIDEYCADNDYIFYNKIFTKYYYKRVSYPEKR